MSNQILVKCTRSSRRDFGDTATMSVAATIDVKRSGKGTVCLFVAIHTAIQQYVSLRATRDARDRQTLRSGEKTFAGCVRVHGGHAMYNPLHYVELRGGLGVQPLPQFTSTDSRFLVKICYKFQPLCKISNT